MASIDTPLLIVGPGPAALVAAKAVSSRGLPCLVAGHEPLDDETPVVLDPESLAVLEPHGVLDVLRPYANTQEPFTITPLLFEQGLKHHCVADMLITVYDGMSLQGPTFNDDEHGADGAMAGELTDGHSTWNITADAYLDAATLPTDLNQAIHAAAAYGAEVMDRLSRSG